jgi:hypothetical protein
MPHLYVYQKIIKEVYINLCPVNLGFFMLFLPAILAAPAFTSLLTLEILSWLKTVLLVRVNDLATRAIRAVGGDESYLNLGGGGFFSDNERDHGAYSVKKAQGSSCSSWRWHRRRDF